MHRVRTEPVSSRQNIPDIIRAARDLTGGPMIDTFKNHARSLTSPPEHGFGIVPERPDRAAQCHPGTLCRRRGRRGGAPGGRGQRHADQPAFRHPDPAARDPCAGDRHHRDRYRRALVGGSVPRDRGRCLRAPEPPIEPRGAGAGPGAEPRRGRLRRLAGHGRSGVVARHARPAAGAAMAAGRGGHRRSDGAELHPRAGRRPGRPDLRGHRHEFRRDRRSGHDAAPGDPDFPYRGGRIAG